MPYKTPEKVRARNRESNKTHAKQLNKKKNKQQETNNKIHSLKNQIIRLEKIVVISAGLLIAGMGTIIIELFRRV